MVRRVGNLMTLALRRCLSMLKDNAKKRHLNLAGSTQRLAVILYIHTFDPIICNNHLIIEELYKLWILDYIYIYIYIYQQ